MEDLLSFLCKLIAVVSGTSFEQLVPEQIFASRPSTGGATEDDDIGYFVNWILSPKNEDQKRSRLHGLGYVLAQNQWFLPDGNRGEAALVWMMAQHCSTPLANLQDKLNHLRGLITVEECHQFYEKWVHRTVLPDLFAGAPTKVIKTFSHCLEIGKH